MKCISQSGEEEYPFEFHVTVIDAIKHDFKVACVELKVKAIIIALQKNDGALIFNDVMTSSKFHGTDAESHVELLRISDGLYDRGFHVVRKKIETIPSHHLAPSDSNKIKMGKGQYFETHIGVQLRRGQDRAVLAQIVDLPYVHLSSNPFKKYANWDIIMVTLRRDDLSSEEFRHEAGLLEDTILNGGYTVEDSIVEFAICDSRIKHDEEWING